MTGGQGPRDWDKELAQIDKLIAAGGAPQTPPVAPMPRNGSRSGSSPA